MSTSPERRGFDMRTDWFLIAFWPTLGAISTAIQTVSRLTQGNAVDWPRVAAALMPWIGWSLLTPVIVFMARRCPLAQGNRRLTGVPLHILTLFAMAAVHSTFVYATRYAIFGSLAPASVALSRDLSQRLPVHLTFDTLVYLSTLMAIYTMDASRRYQDDAMRTTQLEAEVARTELDLMTAQVQPQFVLSTLNAVRRLLPESPAKADRVVSRLSEILRLSLENVSAEQIRLIDELEFLRRLFEIEQSRHSGAVDFDTSGDGDLLDAFVPNLLLQDLAVAWVGELDAATSLNVRADVARGPRGLLIRFEVSGAGIEISPGEAVIERSRKRLQRFAGGEWDLQVTRDDGAVAVEMQMPERFSQDAEAHGSAIGGAYAGLR